MSVAFGPAMKRRHPWVPRNKSRARRDAGAFRQDQIGTVHFVAIELTGEGEMCLEAALVLVRSEFFVHDHARHPDRTSLFPFVERFHLERQRGAGGVRSGPIGDLAGNVQALRRAR